MGRAQAELRRVQREHSTYQSERDAAEAAHLAARPGLAVAAAEVLRDAETVLAASQRHLDAAQRSVGAAQQDLAGARKAVSAAVRVVATTEIRELFEVFKLQTEQLQRTRARLLGQYLVIPGALTDEEWRDVDCRDIVSAADMNIGLPITYLKDVNWRNHRDVVNVVEQAFREHLAQLERGDDPPSILRRTSTLTGQFIIH